MDNRSKTFGLFLILILAFSGLSLLMVRSANAQSVPAPSVPQFTVKYVNDSQGVTINPYSGQGEINQTVNDFIEVTIQNQQLGYAKDGSYYQIYFNIRVKAHFSPDNWTEVYPVENLTSSSVGWNQYTYAGYVAFDSPNQTSSSDTTINFPVVQATPNQTTSYALEAYNYGMWYDFLYAIPYGIQLDFEVEAIIGHNSTYWGPVGDCSYPAVGCYTPAIAYDTSSGWSAIQTVTIGQTSNSSPPTPTPTSNAKHATNSTSTPTKSSPIISAWTPSVTILVIAIIAAWVLLVSLLLHRRHRKTANLNH